MKPLRFAIIGAAGYVAPRHMHAIKTLGHTLVAAYDPYDGVGILDSYFPEADFFTEFERFDRHLEKLKRSDAGIDYLVVCSPNYLHDAHIRFGLRLGAHVICEKPVVLNPWNVEALIAMESASPGKVNTILQLRHFPTLIALRDEILGNKTEDPLEVELTYITARGNWYYSSWKGDISKSGGIATNIGIHFFDLLLWIFGPVVTLEVHQKSHDRASGFLKLKHANVKWFLSIDPNTLPDKVVEQKGRTYRVLNINGKSIEFSEGFQELHTHSYAEILAGKGFGLTEALPSISLAHRIRIAETTIQGNHVHSLALLPQSPHPFLFEKN